MKEVSSYKAVVACQALPHGHHAHPLPQNPPQPGLPQLQPHQVPQPQASNLSFPDEVSFLTRLFPQQEEAHERKIMIR